jgi:Peptidase inhibitor family I36
MDHKRDWTLTNAFGWARRTKARVIATATTALAAVALTFIGLASVVPGTAAAASSPPPIVVSSQAPAAAAHPNVPPPSFGCLETYLCAWVSINYNGNEGFFSDANTHWSDFSQSTCVGGTWNDCASALQNDGSSYSVVYQNANDAGGSFTLSPGGYVSNLTLLTFTNGVNMNDAISSNSWHF